MEILRPDEIEQVEREFPSGLSARAVVEIFRPKGVRLSEATFRKYIQAGLLPRSRRVGRKGKHRGSQGLYPVAVVRRINAIKKMMAEGMTLEEIKRSFVVFKNQVEQIDRGLAEVFDGVEVELEARPFGADQRRRLGGVLEGLRQRAEELVRDVTRLGSAVTMHSNDRVSDYTAVR